MNKIYRVVWNKSTQTWTAVSEYATAQGKSNSRSSVTGSAPKSLKGMRFVYTALASASLMMFGGQVMAADGNKYPVGTAIGDAYCYFDSASQSVVCGDVTTKTEDRVDTKTAKSVVIGSGATNAGESSVAIGTGSSSAETASVAIGSVAKALHNQTVAIGQNAEAHADWDISIGRFAGQNTKNPSTEGRNIAIGDGALKSATSPNNNTAIGTSAGEGLTGNANVMIGTYANSTNVQSGGVTASNTVAIGDRALASSSSSVGIGNRVKATGGISVAIGASAEAKGGYSIAQGYAATAAGTSSIAIGSAQNVPNQTRANGNYATAIGFAANAGAEGAIAIGRQANHDINGAAADPNKTTSSDRAKTTGADSIAIGTNTNAAAKNAVSLGTQSRATGENSIAQGTQANAGANGAIAMGIRANAESATVTRTTGANSIAVGVDTHAGANHGVAIGSNASTSTTGQGSVALGASSKAYGVNAAAVGQAAEASGQNSFAGGNDSHAIGTSAVAIGDGAGKGTAVIANGVKTSGDYASGASSTAVGAYTKSAGEGSTAVGLNADAQEYRSVAVGAFSTAGANGSVAIGDSAKAIGKETANVAIGNSAYADASGALAIGIGASAKGLDVVTTNNQGVPTNDKAKPYNAIAIGTNANVDSILATTGTTQERSTDAIAIGTNSKANYASTIAIGNGAKANTKSSATAIGLNSDAQGWKSLAIGVGAVAKQTDSVALGSESVADVGFSQTGVDPLGAREASTAEAVWRSTKAAVSVGNIDQKITRQITSVAAGTKDTDAVNVAQLKAAGFKLSASHTGGGESTTIADDKIQNGETVTIDAGKNIKVAHTANMVSVATKDNVNFDSVTIGNSGVSLTGGGLNNGGKTIVGVAKGENDTDAVNVKQLQDALAAANVTITTQVDSNAPFAYVNANGETLIRQPDGTFYKANDSNKTSYNGDDVTIAALNPKAPQTTVATKVGNIAKGTKDNDAVNVSQLKDTVTILGGGAMIADGNDPAVPAGTLVAPTYKVVDASGKAVPNINDAKDIGTALTNLNSYINTGFDVQGNGITEGTVTPTEKINFVDGTNTKAVVSKETNGVTNITFDVNAQTLAETAQLPVVYTDADTGGKVYKHTDGSFYTQQNGAGTKIDPPKVIASMQDSAGSTTNPTRLANVDTGKNDKDAVNVSQLKGAATALGGNSTINPDGTFKAPEYTIAKTDGTNHTTVNNVGEALKNLNDEVVKPLAFAGDSGNNITRKLGSTVNVKGGADVNKLSDKNIGVVADGTDTLTVKLAKELTGLTSAQFGDTNGDHTTINQNGVTIANGPSVTKSGISAGNKTISNVADGVNDTDAVNVSQLNAAKTKVTSGDKSITVTPNVSTNTYDLAVNTDDATIVKDPTTGALKANTTQLAVADGKVTAPATTDVGKLATAGDIANAINNSGFTLTAGGANGSVVNPGDSVDLKNTDKNIVVSKTTGSNDINFDLAPTIKIGPSTGGSPIIINGTAGEITGLNANLPTTQNNTAAGQPSNATTAQTAPTNADTIKNNAATVGDVLNAGFNVQTNGTATDFVKAYDTINFADGTGTTIISETDGATTTFKVNVNAQTLAETAQLPVVYTKADGTKVYKVGDKFFDNKEGTGTEVLAKDIIASMQNADGTTATPTKLANIANGTVNQTSKDAVNGGQLFAQGEGVKNIIGGNTTYDSASGTYKNTDIGGTGKATIDEAIKASKNEVVAGKNVTVSSEKGANGQTIYTVATKDDVNFNSVTAGTGTNQVVLDDTGVKVGGNIYVSSTGLNANDKKVTNVADGAIAQDSKDAINGGQLFGEIDKLNANINAAKTEVKGTGLATVSKTQGTNGQDVYSVDVAKAAAPTVARGNVTVDAGDAGKVMTAGDVAKAINNSEKTSSVVAGSTSVTVTAQSEDTKGNTEYSVDLSAATKAQLAKEESVSAGNTNITVAKDGTNATGGDNYKVTLSNNLDLGVVGSVKAGNTTVNNGGVTITNADPAKNVSLTAGGLNNGGNKITNVANGTDDNDVVNVSQLNELKKIVTGGNTSANVTTKPADTGGATPAGTITTTVTNPDGTTTTTTEVNQTVVTSKDKGGKEYRLTTYNVEGQNTYVTNDVIQAIGKMNEQGIKFFHTNDGEVKPTIQGSNTVDSSASGAYATAIGYQADAQGENAIAFGKGSKATGKNSLAIGTGNIVTGENSGAIGDPSIINGSNSYSVGNNNTVTENNTFVLGNNVTQTVKDSVFLGDKSSSTGIHTTANGGNYTYAGANDANVAGVANSTTAPDTKPVGVVSVGTENGATRQIQNVAAGVVSPTSTDAINGSQLYDTHQAITNLAVQTNQRIGDVEDNANAGVSSAMAMASLPQAYIPGKSMLTGGVASYNGEGAVAVGLSKLSDNGRWVLKMSGSADTKGNAGASIGAGFHF